MAADKHIRAAQHRHHFYPHELAVIETACRVLGKDLGDITRGQAADLASLLYSAPHCDRRHPDRALDRLRLAGSAISTFCRYEFGLHANLPGFSEAVGLIVLGADEPDDADTAEPSIMRDLLRVLSVAKRGA